MSLSLCTSTTPKIAPLPDLLKLFKPLTSPDKFKDLCNMLRDRESVIKMEWENIEKDWHLMKEQLGMLERLAELDAKKFERKKRECQDLNQKITRLSKDEKLWSDRARQSEDYRAKVREQLSVVTSEKNREISELNKSMGMLNNQILERDQKIELYELELKNYEEKVAQIEKELLELKDRESEFDQTMVEMEELRNKNDDAANIIGELRNRIICVETENISKDNTIKELEQKLSGLKDLKRQKLDAEEIAQVSKKKLESLTPTIAKNINTIKELEQKLEELKRQKLDAEEVARVNIKKVESLTPTIARNINTIKELEQKLEELKHQKLDAEEVARVNIKKVESLAPEITRLREGLGKIYKVDIQDIINIINSNGTSSDATPSLNGEKENLASDGMHASNGSLNTGNPKLLQYSRMEDGNGNEINAENNGIYQQKEIEMSEGPDVTPNSNCEKEKLGYCRMHACNASQKTGSPKLPENFRMQEGTENEKSAENIGIDQEMETETSEGSDCIEIDKTTFVGLESRENGNMISGKFPVTSFIMKMRRNDKKWVLEDDMLSDFEEDEELCMNAVLVLYRQQIFASADSYRELCDSDTKSVRDLGEYLLDQSSGFLPGKSLTQVKNNRPDVVVQCKRLATVYIDKLFHLYLNGEDPLFKLIKCHKLR